MPTDHLTPFQILPSPDLTWRLSPGFSARFRSRSSPDTRYHASTSHLSSLSVLSNQAFLGPLCLPVYSAGLLYGVPSLRLLLPTYLNLRSSGQHPSIHPPSCLALLLLDQRLLHRPWEPFCPSLPQAPGCLRTSFISRSDMAGPAHWLPAEACGQGIKRITMC